MSTKRSTTRTTKNTRPGTGRRTGRHRTGRAGHGRRGAARLTASSYLQRATSRFSLAASSTGNDVLRVEISVLSLNG